MSEPGASEEFARGRRYRVVWTDGGGERTAVGMFIGEDHPWFRPGFAFDRMRQDGGVFVVPHDAVVVEAVLV